MSDSTRGPEIHVTMPDGSVWAVDAHTVEREYVRYYSKLDGSTRYTQDYLNVLLDDHHLLDWAVDNLNWADVALTARLVSVADVDFQQGWLSGAKKVVRPAQEIASASV